MTKPVEEVQSSQVAEVVTAPVIAVQETFGMSADVYEQWLELGQRWDNDNLAKRLSERMQEHLVTNPITRDLMIEHV